MHVSPPELQGLVEPSPAADWWSLGAILFEILTGTVSNSTRIIAHERLILMVGWAIIPEFCIRDVVCAATYAYRIKSPPTHEWCIHVHQRIREFHVPCIGKDGKLLWMTYIPNPFQCSYASGYSKYSNVVSANTSRWIVHTWYNVFYICFVCHECVRTKG